MIHYEIHFTSGSVWHRLTKAVVIAELRALRRHNSLAGTTVERHRWVREMSDVSSWPALNFLRGIK